MTAKHFAKAAVCTVRYALTDWVYGRCGGGERAGICAFPVIATLLARILAYLQNCGTFSGLLLTLLRWIFREPRFNSRSGRRAISCGETGSYQQFAATIENPRRYARGRQRAARINWRDVILRHRVVRRDGALSGYRWGVRRKAQLLKREAQKEE